ncbi:DUF2026 domain-containing protein [Noviherbaspirillum agri]
MPTARPPLPLADYQRIFRVLKTVLDSADAAPAHPDVFFSMAGAFLVQQLYKKRCQPVAGAAFFRVDDDAGTVLSFADKDHEDLSSDRGFHCWILCEDYIIDFMAPLFRESLQAMGLSGSCSRKMFQKPRSAMSDSPLLMRNPGDFHMLPNVDLTSRVLSEFFANERNNDLVQTCAHWYRKPPKDIPRQATMTGNDGAVSHLTLSSLSLVGAW